MSPRQLAKFHRIPGIEFVSPQLTYYFKAYGGRRESCGENPIVYESKIIKILLYGLKI